MAFVNSLPPELLSHVFGLLLDPLDPTLEDIVTSVGPAPTLSLVSRYWNQVTLGTPSMWTRIVLGRNFSSLPAIEQHLKRSGDLPLAIFIHDSALSIFALPALSSQSYRWRTLYMIEMTDWDLDFLSNLALPTLHSLRINAFSVDKSQSLLEAPQLRHFAFKGVDSIFRDICQPSLSTLETDTSWDEWDPLWPYLRSSQSTLRRLKLTGVEDVILLSEESPLRLPCLTEYEVSMPILDWNALRIADMPALTRLSWFWEDSYNDTTDGNIPSMPSLQILELSTRYELYIGSAIAPLLSATPNIIKLCITDISPRGSLVNSSSTDSLCLKSEEDCDAALYCTGLEELSITGTQVTMRSLEDIVISRPSLRKITVTSVDWDWESIDTDRVILDKLRGYVELIGVKPMWQEGYY